MTDDDRLNKIDKSLQQLTSKIEKHIDITSIHQNNMSQIIEDHKRILYGNGTNGLLSRMERMETTNKVLNKVSWSGLVAGLGAIASKLLIGKE